jgi:hypothetical protein
VTSTRIGDDGCVDPKGLPPFTGRNAHLRRIEPHDHQAGDDRFVAARRLDPDAVAPMARRRSIGPLMLRCRGMWQTAAIGALSTGT